MTAAPAPHTSNLIEEIETLSGRMESILDQAGQLPGFAGGRLEPYRSVCKKIPDRIRSGRLKIAVVGVIKSGKSTFVNGYLGKEAVQRGAGVVTAITTRIRKGAKNRARLYFRSWDDINTMIRGAIARFPGQSLDGIEFDASAFDIRRQKDRECLQSIYKELKSDTRARSRGVRPEVMLIHHALTGYDACKPYMEADETCLEFDAKGLDGHKAFTADQDRAFYVKDVCIELYGKRLDPFVELADCQGADSTDPSSLSQVIAYLETAGLIVYCISSRTGLRESDLALLKRIARLHLSGHIVFVNNCDLSEHESLDDLIRIEQKILTDLSFLDMEPALYSVSALYHLFKGQEKQLNRRDAARLALWRQDPKMLAYVEKQQKKLDTLLARRLEQDRDSFLVSNGLAGLEMVCQGLVRESRLISDLLSKDRQKEERAAVRLKNRLEQAARLEQIVSNSLPGAVKGLKADIRHEIRQFFQTQGDALVREIRRFSSKISLEPDQYRSQVSQGGLKKIIYLMFQDYKRQLDLYQVEVIMPQITQFGNTIETLISERFSQLFTSYQVDLLDADETSGLENHNDQQIEPYKAGSEMSRLDLESMKTILGLSLPDRVIDATESAGGKVRVFSRFWFLTLAQLAAHAIHQKIAFSFSAVLAQTGEKIKQDGRAAITRQFKNFQKEVETDYFMPLVDAAIREFETIVNHHFQQYHQLEESCSALTDLNAAEKTAEQQQIIELQEQIEAVKSDLAGARAKTGRHSHH